MATPDALICAVGTKVYRRRRCRGGGGGGGEGCEAGPLTDSGDEAVRGATESDGWEEDPAVGSNGGAFFTTGLRSTVSPHRPRLARETQLSFQTLPGMIATCNPSLSPSPLPPGQVFKYLHRRIPRNNCTRCAAVSFPVVDGSARRGLGLRHGGGGGGLGGGGCGGG